MTLTRAERDRLRELEAKVTSGPWKCKTGYVGAEHVEFVSAKDHDGFRPWDGDAPFIVAARNALPALLDALDAQDAIIQRLKDGTSFMCSYCSFEADTITLEGIREHLKICPFHPLREKDAEIARLKAEIERLKATLDGDPHQTATPDQRRMWRASAVRYGDKCEAEIARLTSANATLINVVSKCEAAMAVYSDCPKECFHRTVHPDDGKDCLDCPVAVAEKALLDLKLSVPEDPGEQPPRDGIPPDDEGDDDPGTDPHEETEGETR